MLDSDEDQDTSRTINDMIEEDMAHLVQWMSKPEAKDLLRTMNALEAQEECKSASLSNEWRRKAKAAFTEQQHDAEVHRRSWDCVTQALATAPLKSVQYLLALDARSKILQHMGMMRECEVDVDRALEELKGRSEFRSFKCELLLRKMQCWLACMSYIPAMVAQRFLVHMNEIPPSKKSEYLRIYNKIRVLNPFSADVLRHGDTEDVGQRIRLPQVRHHPRFLYQNSDAIAVKFFLSPRFNYFTFATRPLSPSDVISVEPLFAAMPERKDDPMICGHCLALSWTPVPCFDCRMLFCTERCRDKAIRKYHYYECVLMRNELGMIGNDWFNDRAKLGLRMLIMARVECGSNEVLMERIRGFDNGFAPLECLSRTKRFDSIFVLGAQFKANEFLTCASVTALIAVAKRCALFKDSFYEFDSIENLIDDREAVELGALILRYIVISQYYSQTIFEPNIKTWKDKHWQFHFAADPVPPRGRTMSAIVSYFNHSCHPNVATLFNDDGQLILYVLRPILEGEEMNPHMVSHYMNGYKPVSDKKLLLSRKIRRRFI